MKVALIAPADLLFTVTHEDVHMVIPEGLRVSPVYRDFYAIMGKMGKKASKHIMLDNGAFEAEGASTGLSFEQLVNMIFQYGVDTFCLPDQIGSHHLSVGAAEKFLHQWNTAVSLGTFPAARRVRFLAILQGTDKSELQACFRDYCKLEEEFEISLMIGLPRWIADEINAQIRYRLAEYIEKRAPHAIHLLGMTRLWPLEVLRVAQNLPDVVSIDTSAPYVWTLNGNRLGVPGTASERVENYFTHDSRHMDEGLLVDNIDTLKGWASGN